MGKHKKRHPKQGSVQPKKTQPLEMLKWISVILSILASIKKLVE